MKNLDGLGFLIQILCIHNELMSIPSTHNGDYEYSTARNHAKHGQIILDTLLLLYSKSLECWVLKLNACSSSYEVQTTAVAVESLDLYHHYHDAHPEIKRFAGKIWGLILQQWEIWGFWCWLKIFKLDLVIFACWIFFVVHPFFGASQKHLFPPILVPFLHFSPALWSGSAHKLRSGLLSSSSRGSILSCILAPQCSDSISPHDSNWPFWKIGEVEGAEHTYSTTGSIVNSGTANLPGKYYLFKLCVVLWYLFFRKKPRWKLLSESLFHPWCRPGEVGLVVFTVEIGLPLRSEMQI